VHQANTLQQQYEQENMRTAVEQLVGDPRESYTNRRGVYTTMTHNPVPDMALHSCFARHSTPLSFAHRRGVERPLVYKEMAGHATLLCQGNLSFWHFATSDRHDCVDDVDPESIPVWVACMCGERERITAALRSNVFEHRIPAVKWTFVRRFVRVIAAFRLRRRALAPFYEHAVRAHCCYRVVCACSTIPLQVFAILVISICLFIFSCSQICPLDSCAT